MKFQFDENDLSPRNLAPRWHLPAAFSAVAYRVRGTPARSPRAHYSTRHWHPPRQPQPSHPLSRSSLRPWSQNGARTPLATGYRTWDAQVVSVLGNMQTCNKENSGPKPAASVDEGLVPFRRQDLPICQIYYPSISYLRYVVFLVARNSRREDICNCHQFVCVR